MKQVLDLHFFRHFVHVSNGLDLDKMFEVNGCTYSVLQWTGVGDVHAYSCRTSPIQIVVKDICVRQLDLISIFNRSVKITNCVIYNKSAAKQNVPCSSPMK